MTESLYFRAGNESRGGEGRQNKSKGAPALSLALGSEVLQGTTKEAVRAPASRNPQACWDANA